MNYEITQATTIYALVVFISAGIMTKLSIAPLTSLLKAARCTRLNYRGKEVTYGAGIVFIPINLLISALLMFIFKSQYMIYSSYIIGVCAVGFAGFLDDMVGEKNIKGLANHFLSFLHGHLTTGFIKAFMGGVASIIISIGISKGILDFFLNALNMALFTNTLNLMDLRPGRCVKAFIFLGTLIFILNIRYFVMFLPLGVTLIIASIYLNYDLKEVCMLGDAGSNILGITLGYFSSINGTLAIKIILAIALITINISAEKVSFSAIISQNKFLSYLDSFGRSG